MEEDSALSVNGKKNKLTRDDFDKLAGYLNIPVRIRYEKFIKSLVRIEPVIRASEIKQESQERFVGIVKERLLRMDLV
jgi:hypothetical protein